MAALSDEVEDKISRIWQEMRSEKERPVLNALLVLGVLEEDRGTEERLSLALDMTSTGASESSRGNVGLVI